MKIWHPLFWALPVESLVYSPRSYAAVSTCSSCRQSIFPLSNTNHRAQLSMRLHPGSWQGEAQGQVACDDSVGADADPNSSAQDP